MDKQAEALECLGLDTGASWQEIQTIYRQQVGQHHPDKGGEKIRFMEIRRAYELLKKGYVQ